MEAMREHIRMAEIEQSWDPETREFMREQRTREIARRARELPREDVETAITASEGQRSRRMVLGMMGGQAAMAEADAEERAIAICRAVLADPGANEHVAELQARIRGLEIQLRLLEAQRDHARNAALEVARGLDMECGDGSGAQCVESAAPGDGWQIPESFH